MAQQFVRNYSTKLATGKAISIDPRTAKGVVCDFLIKVERRKTKELLKKTHYFKKTPVAAIA